jgi:sulfatase modifying factor 1
MNCLMKSRKNGAAMPTTETLPRRRKNASRAWVSACVLVGLLTGHAMAVNIDMVSVGNPRNAPDTRYNGISVGSVGYNYQIGKYEVTAGQYTEFLNAVAKADPNGLYNTEMGNISDFYPGANIQQTGSSPHFSYSVAADWANRPVNYVSFWDAARFANWLHNGQPTGPQGPATTESGAYHDVGNQTLFGRNAGAKFFVPTEDEWYKAAYHKNDGVTGNYWDYPTASDNVPGNILPDQGKNANFYGVLGEDCVGNCSYTIGSPYYRTNVGDFANSASPYGTFDQGGNVWEWNETKVSSSSRGLRGGSFGDRIGTVGWQGLGAAYRLNDGNVPLPFPDAESSLVGFRVAGVVPEPAAWILALLGAVGLAVGAMRGSSSGRNFVRASCK